MLKPAGYVLYSCDAADLDVMGVQLQRTRCVSTFCKDTGGGSMGALPCIFHLFWAYQNCMQYNLRMRFAYTIPGSRTETEC